MIEVKGKHPEFVTPAKILDFQSASKYNEGITSPVVMFQQANKYDINALLFYSWSCIRTAFFRDECMKRWDLGKIGGNYETFRNGCDAALGELVKYADTTMMPEQKDVESLYKEISDYCAGIVYDQPKPPEQPKPEPKPPEPSEPLPPPPNPDTPKEEPKPSDPSTPWWKEIFKTFDWKTIAKVAIEVIKKILKFLPIPAAIATVVSMVLDLIGGIL